MGSLGFPRVPLPWDPLGSQGFPSHGIPWAAKIVPSCCEFRRNWLELICAHSLGIWAYGIAIIVISLRKRKGKGKGKRKRKRKRKRRRQRKRKRKKKRERKRERNRQRQRKKTLWEIISLRFVSFRVASFWTFKYSSHPKMFSDICCSSSNEHLYLNEKRLIFDSYSNPYWTATQRTLNLRCSDDVHTT